MVRPGPKPRTRKQVLDAGGWRAKALLKAEADCKADKARADLAAIPVVDAEIISEADMLSGIPEYDPCYKADDYRFDYKLACKVVRFFHEELRHVKGEMTGMLFILEPWEQSFIGNLFGWLHKETGMRRYRTSFMMIPKKNGKTPLAAGILMYILYEDKEPGAEIYGAANEYKQASLVFIHASGMRRQNKKLADRSQLFKGQAKAIQVGQPGDLDYAIYRVIGSDADNIEGSNTHAAVVDEVHKQQNRDLIDNLETSTAARRQPLIVLITTRDFERESICNEKEDYAFKVMNKIIDDPTFLPVLYYVENDADWTDPAVWAKANPNLGVSVKLDFIKKECAKAVNLPSFENTFKRLHLNMKTEQDVRWLPIEKWDACAGEIDMDALVGETCYVGLDLSSTQDPSAMALWFPEQKVMLGKVWIPKANAIEREKSDHVPYLTWERQGFITLTPGNVIDYDYIMADIQRAWGLYKIEGLGFDRWMFEAIRQQLVKCDIPEDKMIAFGQGYASMSAPTKELEKKVIGKELIHEGNPVIRWMVSNVNMQTDSADNIKPVKKNKKQRIDFVISAIEAIGIEMTSPAPKQSVYETRGLMSVG